MTDKKWAELTSTVGLPSDAVSTVQETYMHLLLPLENNKAAPGGTINRSAVQQGGSGNTAVIPPVPAAATAPQQPPIDAQRLERQRIMREQMAREEEQRKRAEQLRLEQMEYDQTQAKKAPPPPPQVEAAPVVSVPQQEPQMVLKLSRPIVAPPVKRPRVSAGSTGAVAASRQGPTAEEMKTIVSDLYSADLQTLIAAINAVLLKSSEAEQPILLEDVPELLPALCYLLDVRHIVLYMVIASNKTK